MSDRKGPRPDTPDLSAYLEASSPALALFQTRTKRKSPKRQPSEDDIRLRAYLIWERTGKSKGADECWALAKRELER